MHAESAMRPWECVGNSREARKSAEGARRLAESLRQKDGESIYDRCPVACVCFFVFFWVAVRLPFLFFR